MITTVVYAVVALAAIGAAAALILYFVAQNSRFTKTLVLIW